MCSGVEQNVIASCIQQEYIGLNEALRQCEATKLDLLCSSLDEELTRSGVMQSGGFLSVSGLESL